MSRSVLITGATGYTGSRLARRMVERGDRVTILARHGSSLLQLGEAAEHVAVVRIAESGAGADVADAVEQALERAQPDLVCSLATTRTRASLADVAQIADAVVRLPTLLIAACARERMPLITTASYMHAPGSVAPSIYSALRAGPDPVLEWACAHEGLRAVVLSLTSVHGPGDARAKLLVALLDAARNGTPIDLVHPGRRIDFVHVDDVVEAYLVAQQVLDGDAAGAPQRYDVSSGELLTLADAVELVERLTGRSIDARWNARSTTPSDLVEPPHPPRWLPGWRPARRLSETIAQEFA
jgi:nucleoside-diphosphate-sugar epimerase